jgi:toxin-antitoxin system PIN domain toxin
LPEQRVNPPRYLPDVNVLFALSDQDHSGYFAAARWFSGIGSAPFLLCAVTEAGFVRITANPLVGGRDTPQAIALLEEIRKLPNCESLPIEVGWLELVRPLAARLHGYRQVTDALLLGLAIRQNAILVTLDQHIRSLAANEFAANLLVLK